MATQLFLVTTAAQINSEVRIPLKEYSYDLRTTRGTVATPGWNYQRSTSDTQIANGLRVPWSWMTMPLAADVTISSTVTFNIWAQENSMSANVQLRARLLRLQPDGTVTEIVNSLRGVELSTTASANNWTATPTSTACKAGDSLVLEVYFDDIGTMGTGYIAYMYFGCNSAAATGDSYVTLTENVTFMSSAPTGDPIYLTDTDDTISNGKKAQLAGTAPSDATFTYTTVTGSGPYTGTETGGGPAIRWYTPTLQAQSVAAGILEIVAASQRYANSGDGSQAVVGFRMYKTAGDGTNATLITTGWFGEYLSGATFYDDQLWAPYPAFSIAQGERLAFEYIIGPRRSYDHLSAFEATTWDYTTTSGKTVEIEAGTSFRIYLDTTVSEYVSGTQQSGSDSGTATDTGTLTEVQASGTDSGTATDTGSVVVDQSATDSGTVTEDGSVQVPQSDSDSGTATDNATLTLVDASGTDSGTATDTGTLTEAQASGTDSGTATDDGSVAVQVSDSDSGTATDDGSVNTGGSATIYDDFNRADTTRKVDAGEGLGSNWDDEGWVISSNTANRSGSNAYAVWMSPTDSADHYVEVHQATGTNSEIALVLRKSSNAVPPSGTDDWYEAVVATDGSVLIMRYTNGAYSGDVDTGSVSTTSDPVTYKFVAEGSNLKFYRNDILIAEGTDSNHTGLYVGMECVRTDQYIDYFEAGGLGEAPTPQSDSDSGTATDDGAVTSISASDSDTGTATDNATLTVEASSSDTGTATDDATLAVAVSDSDSGTATDNASITSIAASDSDTATATDNATLTSVEATGSDTGTATDDGSVVVNISDSDSGTATDNASLEGENTYSDSDSATATDTGVLTEVQASAFDSAAGVDNGSVVVNLSDSDSATATDNATFTVEATATDTGAATDDATLTVYVTGSDSGVATDSGSNEIYEQKSDSDSGVATDDGAIEIVTGGTVLNDAVAVYYGAIPVIKIYAGSVQVWP